MQVNWSDRLEGLAEGLFAAWDAATGGVALKFLTDAQSDAVGPVFIISGLGGWGRFVI